MNQGDLELHNYNYHNHHNHHNNHHHHHHNHYNYHNCHNYHNYHNYNNYNIVTTIIIITIIILIYNFSYRLFFRSSIVESKCFPLNPCKHGGTCHEDDTDYKCTCMPGWDGISCESKDNIRIIIKIITIIIIIIIMEPL